MSMIITYYMSMSTAIIRTDKWRMQADQQTTGFIRLTIAEYRAFCRALSPVILTNWPQLSQSNSFAAAVERLIHPSAKNPNPRHRYFVRRFYKFPSYLRRAAIEFVAGQVSSYLTRYGQWLDGERKHRHAKPPVLTPESGCYPAMYRGQMFKLLDQNRVELKLWNGKEWLWYTLPAKKRHRHNQGTIKSPSLVLQSGRKHKPFLSVPIKLKPTKRPMAGVVCSVDVGINTLATASIVSQDGTVVARKFFHPAADIDRRNKQAGLIRKAARKTANLCSGFCSQRYRKVRNINKQIAHLTSKQLVQFALAHGTAVMVLEQLKNWRPRAGKKRSPLKQKFYQWLHRQLVTFTEQKFVEAGGRMVSVYPRGTSSYAFDGSGLLSRSQNQYELATFSSGKRYNCDLSASYNIGARYWAMKFKLIHRKDGQVLSGRSSGNSPRIPVTLSTLWLWSDAPH
jgi:putative transposase